MLQDTSVEFFDDAKDEREKIVVYLSVILLFCVAKSATLAVRVSERGDDDIKPRNNSLIGDQILTL